jgi:hypothetical protein
VIVKLFIAMVVIAVYPQCNFNTLNVIATNMLQLFKMFIIIVIQNIFLNHCNYSACQNFNFEWNTLNMLQMRYDDRCN